MPGEHLRIFAVTGNGPPFPRMLAALRPLAADPGVELFVQRGAAGAELRDLPGEDFISREAFAERLAWADSVVTHGGAGTLFEAWCAGHAPIVVPRLGRLGEHVNDHQLELARALADAGRARLCTDQAELARLVHTPTRRGMERGPGDERLVGAVRGALLGETTPRRRASALGVLRALARRALGARA